MTSRRALLAAIALAGCRENAPAPSTAPHDVLAAGVSVAITRPADMEFVGDVITIHATVQSASKVESITAHVRNRKVALQWSSGWRGTLSLAGMPRDTMTLRLVARAVNGDTGVATIVLQHDLPPVAHITLPETLSVARPTIRLVASCTDDDPQGCAGLRILYGTTSIATTSASIDTVLDLTPFDGTPGWINIAPVPRSGPAGAVKAVPIFVESSTMWTTAFSVHGRIVDALDSRVLVRHDTPGGGMLSIVDRPTGAADDLSTYYGTPWARLTTRGAVFQSPELVEFRDGDRRDLCPTCAVYATSPNARYFVYQSGSEQHVRDADADVDAVTSSDAAAGGSAVTDGGAVYFWSLADFEVHRWQDGVVTALTSSPDNRWWNIAPRSDGERVLFLRQPPGAARSRIMLLDSAGRGVPLTNVYDRPQRFSYEVRDGYLAYSRLEDGVLQLVVRSPDGVDHPLTSGFGTPSNITAMGPNGRLLLASGVREYLAAPPYEELVDVGASWTGAGARYVWIGLRPYVLIGRMMFRIGG